MKTSFFKYSLAPLLALSFFVLCPLSAYALEDVNPLLLSQQNLENEINSSLDNWIAQSQASTENLIRVMTRLESVSNEAETLRTERDELSIYSANMSKQCNEFKTQIIELSRDLRLWKRVCITLILINLLGKIVAIILRKFGISLPEIINILW